MAHFLDGAQHAGDLAVRQQATGHFLAAQELAGADVEQVRQALAFGPRVLRVERNDRDARGGSARHGVFDQRRDGFGGADAGRISRQRVIPEANHRFVGRRIGSQPGGLDIQERRRIFHTLHHGYPEHIAGPTVGDEEELRLFLAGQSAADQSQQQANNQQHDDNRSFL